MEEELYDDAAVVPTDTAAAADADDYELYQEAGDTRAAYSQGAESQGISARALYDYQAGQCFELYCLLLF